MPASDSRVTTPRLSRQQYLDLYYYMRLNREVEETMTRLFRQNKIVGGLYSPSGRKPSRSARLTPLKSVTGSPR